jgi:hypothetical protein
MELKDITLNTMATVGVLRNVDLSTDLAKVFCLTKTRVENPDLWSDPERVFNADLNDLIEVIENTGLDVYGTGGEPMEKPTETIPAIVWSEDVNLGEPNKWIVYIYADPTNGSPRITAMIYCGHGYSYLVKIA